MNNILLVNLWNSIKYFGNYKVHENLGIEYINAYLNSKGLSSDYYDMNVLDFEFIEASLKEMSKQYKLIGISIHENNYSQLKKVTDYLKKLYPESHLMVGGMFATYYAQEILTECKSIDSVIRGEGEIAFYNLYKALEEGGNKWKTNLSIAYMENYSYFENELENKFDFRLIKNFERITTHKHKPNRYHINATRGCNKNCSFCSACHFSRLGKGENIRHRDAEDIAEEMISLYENYYPFSKICIVDDNFLATEACMKRALKLAEIIISKNLYIPFKIDTCIEKVEYNLFSKLKQAGLCEVLVGIESFSSNSLKVYNKQITADNITSGLKTLSDLKIHTRMAWIMFHPYITLEDLIENLDFLENINLFFYFADLIGSVRLQKGSSLYDKVKEEGIMIDGMPYAGWKFKDKLMAIYYNELVTSKFNNLLITAHNKTFYTLREHDQPIRYDKYIKIRKLFIIYMRNLALYISKNEYLDRSHIDQEFKGFASNVIKALHELNSISS